MVRGLTLVLYEVVFDVEFFEEPKDALGLRILLPIVLEGEGGNWRGCCWENWTNVEVVESRFVVF